MHKFDCVRVCARVHNRFSGHPPPALCGAATGDSTVRLRAARVKTAGHKNDNDADRDKSTVTQRIALPSARQRRTRECVNWRGRREVGAVGSSSASSAAALAMEKQ